MDSFYLVVKNEGELLKLCPDLLNMSDTVH